MLHLTGHGQKVLVDNSDCEENLEVTREDIKVFSPVFHSKVHLQLSSLEPSVSISDLNDFLQGSSPLGSVTFRPSYFSAVSFLRERGKQLLPVSEISFESPVVKVTYFAYEIDLEG
jgi:hypothetical protein